MRTDSAADLTAASDGRLRILLVSPGFPPTRGGVEEHVARLADELAGTGHTVEVLTARRGLRAPVVERRGDTAVRVFPAWSLRSMSVSPRLVLAAVSARRSADVLHVHSYHASNAVAVLNPWFRGRVIFTPHFHGGGHTETARVLHRLYRRLGTRLFGAASAIVCVSRAERDQLLTGLPAAERPAVSRKLRVVPNGVAVRTLQLAEPFDGEPPTVLSVGRVEGYKGIDRVIASFADLPGEARLVVIGDGSHLPALRSQIARAGLSERVQLLGSVPETTLHRWLRTARVLVSVSEHEAFGMAPLEAAAAGCRVILSDIPAHREIAADYLDGIGELIDGHNPAELTAALNYALGHEPGRPGAGGASIPSWTDVAAETAGIYRALADTSPGRLGRLGRARRGPAGRDHAISPIDLPWTGFWSGMAARPLDMAPLAEVRQAMLDFVEDHPDHLLAGRMDRDAGRWRPVPPAERRAHVEKIIRATDPADRLDPAHIAEALERYRPPLDSPEPLHAVIGPDSIQTYLAHAAGDAATFTEVVLRLARADAAGLAELNRRLRLRDLSSVLLHQDRVTYRGWLARAARILRPSRTGDPEPPTSVAPEIDQAATVAGESTAAGAAPGRPGPPRPGYAGCVLSNADLRAITKWRNSTNPGASITAVLASRTYAGFVAAGVPLERFGFYSLFDVRSVLPADAQLWGNLGKSLYLPADLADPLAVDAAIKAVLAGRRVIPAVAAGALLTLFSRHASRLVSPVASRLTRRTTRPPAVDPTPVHEAPVVMTFSSMPSLPGLAAMPWVPDAPRRYFALGYPTGPDGLSIFAARFRDRMEITASFDRSRIDPDQAQRAIEAVAV